MTSTGTLTVIQATKKVRFTDTTDYDLLGFDLNAAQAKGLGTIYAQGEILVQLNTVGSPLIDLQSGATYYEFDAVLDGNGDIAQITYQVDYALRMAPTGLQIASTGTVTTVIGDGNAEYAQFLEAGDTLVFDGTVDANRVIDSVDDLVSGNPSYTLTASIDLNTPYDSYGFDVTRAEFSTSWTYSGCTQIAASAVMTYDCEYGDFGTWAISNTTPITDQTLVSLDATITWPPLTGLDPIVVTTLPYTNNTLARGTYSINLTEVLQQTQADGLIIQYTTNFLTEFPPVVCTTNATICGLMTCFNHLLQDHLSAIASAKLSPYQASYDAAVGELNKYYVYKSCSETTKASASLAALQGVLDSSGCDCGCGNSSEPSGSIWVNNTNTTGVFQWTLFDGVPSVNQDAAHGYTVGSVVMNINTLQAYVCEVSTTGAAEWEVYYDPSAPIDSDQVALSTEISQIPTATNVQEALEDLAGMTVLTVYDGLAAEGTDENTTAVLEYGVNVFTTITGTDFCAKLPQPTTGRSTRVVNMTNYALVLYPSNIGGQINNLPIDTPVSIPPNGVAYEFVCIENPLPGAWTWTPPATGQYDSGVVTGNTTGGANNVTMAANNANQIERSGYTSVTGWAYDGKNNPLILSVPATYVAFKPSTPWLGITKIKVYTNLSATGANVEFGLTAAIGTNNYDTGTGDFVSNGPITAGNYGLPGSYYGGCNQEIAGGSIPLGTLTTNVGDAGTCWGELTIIGGALGSSGSIIGDVYQGEIGGYDVWLTGYIAFAIRPRQALTGFKFQYFLEYI